METVEERAKAFKEEYKALCEKYGFELHATVNPGIKLVDITPDTTEEE